MSLCSDCHSLDLFAGSPKQIWSEELQIVRKRASLGCGLCSLVLSVALDHAVTLQGSHRPENPPSFEPGSYVFMVHLSLLGNGTSRRKPLYNKLLVTVTRKMWSRITHVPGDTSRQISHDHEICIAADPGSYTIAFMRTLLHR